MKTILLLAFPLLSLAESSSSENIGYQVVYPKVPFGMAAKLCRSKGHELASFHVDLVLTVREAINVSDASSVWLRARPETPAVLFHGNNRAIFYEPHARRTRHRHPVVCKVQIESVSTGPSMPSVNEAHRPTKRPMRMRIKARINGIPADPDSSYIQRLVREANNVHPNSQKYLEEGKRRFGRNGKRKIKSVWS
jgi:hypothetical protein